MWSCVIVLCVLSLAALAQNRNARRVQPVGSCPAAVCADSCRCACPADSLRCPMRPCPKDSTCMKPCAKRAQGCCGKAAVCPRAQKAEGCLKCPSCPKNDSTACPMGMNGAQCKTECLCPAAKGDTTVCAQPRHRRGPRGAHRGR